MRHGFGAIGRFLGSQTLTVWLVGLFVLYYLTMAVWIGEAFARYVTHLSTSALFRTFYLLFLANISVRVVQHIRRSWGPWPTVLLRMPLLLGIVLVLLTFFLSINLRQQQWTPPVGEGDPIVLPWEQDAYRIVKVEPALSKRALRRDDDPRIFDYEPGITLVGRNGMSLEVGAFPPRKVERTFMHVLTFGLGPDVELKRGTQVLGRGYIALRLVPFGQVDTFSLPGQPYQFYLSVVPNELLRKGKETARSYDLERPRYLVEVVKGERTILKEETDTSVSFDRDMKLTFFPPSDWVIIEAVWDPFLPWFAFSLVLVAAGMILYPFSYLIHR